MDFLLQAADENGGKSFNIFIQSVDSKAIRHRDPKAVQAEIKTKIIHAVYIDNVRYTMIGSIIFSTKNVQCASGICNMSEILGV